VISFKLSKTVLVKLLYVSDNSKPTEYDKQTNGIYQNANKVTKVSSKQMRFPNSLLMKQFMVNGALYDACGSLLLTNDPYFNPNSELGHVKWDEQFEKRFKCSVCEQCL
jgi:CMP-N-acetylneuraminic acid synthetase